MKLITLSIVGILIFTGIVGIVIYTYTQSDTNTSVSSNQSVPGYDYVHPEPNISFSPEDWGTEFLRTLQKGPKYLPADLLIEIPPAPASWSEETKAEIQYLHDLEQERTPENAVIRNEEYTNFFPLPGFLEPGEIATTTKPRTFSLIVYVIKEAEYFILREKWKYQRARPYQVDPTLTTDVPHPPHPAYPSGHAGQSRIIALLLSELDPAHADGYISYAESIGKNRELGGVHYPSDTAAGVHLADQLMPELFRNPKFKAELEEARAEEWR